MKKLAFNNNSDCYKQIKAALFLVGYYHKTESIILNISISDKANKLNR